LGKNACMAPDDPTPDVLSSLPRARPQRRSAKRDGAAAKATTRRAAAGTAKKKPAAKKKAAPRRTAEKSKAAAPRIPPAGFQPPREDTGRPAPSGVELVGTAIQAAGELAQIGLSVGNHALRSALGRLGRG